MKQWLILLLLIFLSPPVVADMVVGQKLPNESQYSEEIDRWIAKAEQGDPAAQKELAGIYIKAGLWEKAVELLQKSAEQGYAPGQMGLGFLYEQGFGVHPDMETAITLYRRAADQGNAKAHLALGVLYAKGKGVLRDIDTARSHYEVAANLGNDVAMTNLALMYSYGEGVSKAPEKATKLLLQAANYNNPRAQLYLAKLFEKGEGVEKNQIRAHMWSNISASSANGAAAALLQQLTGDMKPTQLFEAQRLAREWQPAKEDRYPRTRLHELLLEQNEVRIGSYLLIAEYYESGQFGQQDYREAVKLYKEAIKHGSEEAEQKLNSMKERGLIPPD